MTGFSFEILDGKLEINGEFSVVGRFFFSERHLDATAMRRYRDSLASDGYLHTNVYEFCVEGSRVVIYGEYEVGNCTIELESLLKVFDAWIAHLESKGKTQGG